MPNWVFNYLDISGPKQEIENVKKQLNQTFTREHHQWNATSGQMEKGIQTYSNPVFAFWNIIKPNNLEAYYGEQPQYDKDKGITFESDHWYDWNVRNWGTKWDVAVEDDEKYPDTSMTADDEGYIAYRFNTAWSPPVQALEALSAQYPNLDIGLDFEEETGWGGSMKFADGKGIEIESYESKCRDCDSLNTMSYCDNDCGEICSECNYLGEADLEYVAECDIHKGYLDDEHVPEYRMEQLDV